MQINVTKKMEGACFGLIFLFYAISSAAAVNPDHVTMMNFFLIFTCIVAIVGAIGCFAFVVISRLMGDD